MSGIHPRKKQQTQTFQNVKVVVRVRPLTRTEKDQNVRNIVKCLTQRDLLVHKDKKYSFDNVFKPESSQIEVYSKVVAPLIKDVISGYNCTVFAYGQTGTGKTFTMTGDKCNPVGNWKEDEDAGIIPRAAFHIFDELGKLNRHEINVKVSYMELYNEEIRDLLSSDEKSLQLLTDTKGGLVIPGLTEFSVHDSGEICKLLQRGILKRQIAPTLMNHQSSRSHTVFTISVNIRENAASGDDILKLGKINLVDLAGSENIARSGCKDLRAQELANINRSLLTLGRVIHALADKAQGRIPYRDSKLTRILQDSLGGHTKTIVIATVSPAHISHEETTSTLEYATRARDIKNTPIVNEKLNKNEMVQVLLEEIDSLQKDLDAARTGTGFYVDKENYQKILDAIMAVTGERITPEELTERKAQRLRNLEQYLHKRVNEFDETLELCKRHQSELEEAKTAIREKDEHLERERYLSKWYEEHSSQKLTEAQNLLRAAHTLTSEKELLLAKLEHQFNINVNNEIRAQTTVNNLVRMTETFSEEQDNFVDIQKKYGEMVQEQIRNHKSMLEQKFADLKTNASNIDRHRIDSFSVHKSLGGITSNKVELIREKISFFDKIFMEYRKQKRDFKRWVPNLVEAMKVETEKRINQATEAMESTNDRINVYNLEINTYVDLCKKHVNMEKEEAQKRLKLVEDLSKSIKSEIEEKNVLYNYLEQMKLKAEECNLKNQSEMVGNINRLEQGMRDSIKHVKDLSDSYFKFSDIDDYNSDELVNIVKALEEEINAVSYKLDDIYTTVTQEAIDSITQRIESTCDSVEVILNNQFVDLLTKIETMVQSTVAFDDTYRHFAVDIKEALVKQILEKNIPARHVGDTPCRESITYPTNLEQMAPREALLEKFKVQSPKKENSSLFEIDDSDEDS